MLFLGVYRFNEETFAKNSLFPENLYCYRNRTSRPVIAPRHEQNGSLALYFWSNIMSFIFGGL